MFANGLASSNADIRPTQLRELLGGVRADVLLQPVSRYSLEALRDVVATSMASVASANAGPVFAMLIGEINADLTYTPITPCCRAKETDVIIERHKHSRIEVAAVLLQGELAREA